MSSEVKGIFGMTAKCTCMQTHKKMNIEHVEVSTSWVLTWVKGEFKKTKLFFIDFFKYTWRCIDIQHPDHWRGWDYGV